MHVFVTGGSHRRLGLFRPSGPAKAHPNLTPFCVFREQHTVANSPGKCSSNETAGLQQFGAVGKATRQREMDVDSFLSDAVDI